MPTSSEITTSVVNVYVWTDFVCPYCLIGEKLIKEALEGLNAQIVWLPFELRPYPTPTLRPEDSYLQNSWRNGVYPAAKRFGVDLRLPTISPQPYTRTAFIGMQFASEHGLGATYAEAVLSAFFQADRDIGEVDVLVDIAGAIGLNETAFKEALASPAYAQRHEAALAISAAFDVRAVPSILIGEQMVSGIASTEAIRAAVLAAGRSGVDRILEAGQGA